MNRELFKSLLLSVLVFSSIAMTWNILFYKSDFENYKSSNGAVKTASIAEARSVSNVIRPALLLQRSSTATLGETQSSIIQKAYASFQQAVFSDLAPVAYHSQIPERRDGFSYEIVFSAPLMQDTLKKIFRLNEKENLLPENVLIDRIEIYHAKRGGLVAVFSSQDDRAQFFAASVSHLNLSDIKNIFNGGSAAPYEQEKLDGKAVYLPTGKTDVRSVMFYYQLIKTDAFIPILFNDPENSVFHSRGKLTYTDGTSQLEQNGDVLQFVDVNTGISSGSQQISDPIYHSYDFLNNFKEWTDDFSYAGINLSKNQTTENVSFRMRIGDYLAYNTDYYPNPYLAQIDLTWKDGQLSSFNRTLLDLNLIDQPKSVTLDSGKDVLQQLHALSVPVNRIQDLVIGYQLNAPKAQDDFSIEADPDWFYRLDNRWYSLSDAEMLRQLPMKGGNGN